MVQSILIRLGITDPGGPGKKFIHTLFLSLFIYLSRVLSGADIKKSRSSGIVMLAGTYAILDKNWLGIT